MGDEVRMALVNPGPVPISHCRALAKLREEWPALWKALIRELGTTDRIKVMEMAARGKIEWTRPSR